VIAIGGELVGARRAFHHAGLKYAKIQND